MDECVEHARELGRRLGEEQGRTIYLYEHAATRPERRNLAVVRSGEYEALAGRLASGQHAPDFGPATFDPAWGATAVGARNFLIAYNVNLNTTSSRRANARRAASCASPTPSRARSSATPPGSPCGRPAR